LRYVGWPIVPGFDFCGRVVWAGADTGYHEGDRVFGFTMFGAYSSRILVSAAQVRLVPTHLDSASAAALPAVAGTALHALNLAGGWSPPSAQISVPSPSPSPSPPKPHLLLNNKGVLIHSASGGVGSLLVQVCKLAGYSPVVGVVGGAHKIAHCYRMGADVVLCKAAIRGGGGAKGGSDGRSSGSSESSISSGDGCGTGSGDLSTEIMAASPTGYTAIFDANGVDTLAQSFDQLAQNGRLIIYGFHSNLPLGVHALSPMRWLRMAWGLLSMPRFDPMAMVLESKAVLG
jgi:NADPH:quinone reductase-like Zn-dependent oxidoreductase